MTPVDFKQELVLYRERRKSCILCEYNVKCKCSLYPGKPCRWAGYLKRPGAFCLHPTERKW